MNRSTVASATPDATVDVPSTAFEDIPTSPPDLPQDDAHEEVAS